MNRHVAIAIVGYRNAADIGRCLKALEASTHTDFEIVICENGGPDAFAALADVAGETLPGGQPISLIAAPSNLGFAGGVNRCLRETPLADCWWVLNPDTEPEPEALGALLARLSRGDCDAVGGKLVRGDGRVQSCGGYWRPWLARAESIGMGSWRDDTVDDGRVEARQNYLTGACMLMGRSFLETVGPMREDYFLYCEEVEWCLRAVSMGMKLGFAPDAIIMHSQGATTGSGHPEKDRPKLPVYLDTRNKILLTRDLFTEKLPVASIMALGLVALRYGRKFAWRQLGYALEGWLAGVLNKRGAPVFTPPRQRGRAVTTI